MHFLPLLYFSILTFYFWKRHNTFDVATYMSSMYVVTSLCAAIMVSGRFLEGSGVLCDGWEPDLGFIPTILYCLLITVTIIPFSLLRVEKLKTIDDIHPIILWGFVAILGLQALLNLYLVADSTLSLLSGDLRDVRQVFYDEELSPADIKLGTMPGVVRFFNYMNNVTLLALPLFFYYSCVKKVSLWITILLLFISLSTIIKGLQLVDRTEIMNYGLMFLFCLVFFKNVITRKVRLFFGVLSVPVLAIVLTYILAVSSARFEDTSEGTKGSMLQYAGQSYLNFCYFYDHHNESLFYLEREIPVFSYLVLKKDYSEVKSERSDKEGFFIGVFATHVGAWYLDTGIIGTMILSFAFAFLVLLVIRRYNRDSFDVGEMLLLYTLANVPLFGIFYYRFHSFPLAIQYVFAILLFILYKYKFIISSSKKE